MNFAVNHRLCSHGLESCSERRFGSLSKTWLGSWFELRAFTCFANAFPITIRICALRGNILFLLRSPHALIDPCPYAWLQRAFLKCTRMNHVPKELCVHIVESGFLRESRSKTPFFRVSERLSKAWFETALRSHGLKSGFQIRKGPNHVLKCLSERDSSPCEHSHNCVISTSQKIWLNLVLTESQKFNHTSHGGFGGLHTRADSNCNDEL